MMKKLASSNIKSNVITLKNEHQQFNEDKTNLYLFNNLLVSDARKLPSEVSSKLHEKIINSINKSSNVQTKNKIWSYAIAASLFSLSLFSLIYESQLSSPLVVGEEAVTSEINILNYDKANNSKDTTRSIKPNFEVTSLNQERIALISDINKIKEKLMM